MKFIMDEFGLYPPHWWKIWPEWVVYPEHEDGPAELVISFSLFQARKYLKSRLASAQVGGNTFVYYPYDHRFDDNSTKECPWVFPPGHPYQVYGGKYAPDADRWTKQVWTNARKLEGYYLAEDAFSDRRYHIWTGWASL